MMNQTASPVNVPASPAVRDPRTSAAPRFVGWDGGRRCLRVLFLCNLPARNRVDFFNILAGMCDLTVLFERRGSPDHDKQWTAGTQRFRSIFLKGVEAGSDAAFCPGVLRWLNPKLFDVIVIGGYSTPTGILAVESLRLRGIPFLISADGGMVKRENMAKYRLKRHLIASASSWLSSGAVTTDYLTHYGAERSAIKHYPFASLCSDEIGAEPANAAEKAALRAELGLREKRILLGVGRFIPCKGFDRLLGAWPAIGRPDDGLVLVGGGPLRDAYMRRIGRMALTNIHLIDFADRETLRRFYRAADGFILPTLGDTWGLVIGEAMAQGLPVISTDACVAARELIEPGQSGFLCPASDMDRLAAAARALLRDEALAARMGRAALRRVRGLDLESMAMAHIQAFYAFAAEWSVA